MVVTVVTENLDVEFRKNLQFYVVLVSFLSVSIVSICYYEITTN